jgi:hypothetical protein
VIDSILLVTGFFAIAATLIGNLWFTEFPLSYKIAISITTTIWLVTSSIAVMNGFTA